MELYLMQHGASLSKEIDPEEPLSPVGREQVEKSAQACRRLGLDFDLVFCSPKLRARQTALLVARAVDYPERSIQETETVKAMARPGAFLEELGRVRDATRVFVAGHLPHVEALAGMVITKGGKAAIAVENGGLLRLDLPDPGRAEGVLRWYLAPAHLADLAKG